jgi:hypothetical protein
MPWARELETIKQALESPTKSALHASIFTPEVFVQARRRWVGRVMAPPRDDRARKPISALGEISRSLDYWLRFVHRFLHSGVAPYLLHVI